MSVVAICAIEEMNPTKSLLMKFYQGQSEVAIILAGGRRSKGSSPEGESLNMRSP